MLTTSTCWIMTRWAAMSILAPSLSSPCHRRPFLVRRPLLEVVDTRHKQLGFVPDVAGRRRQKISRVPAIPMIFSTSPLVPNSAWTLCLSASWVMAGSGAIDDGREPPGRGLH